MTGKQYYAGLDAIKLAMETTVDVLRCPIYDPDNKLMDEENRLSDDNIRAANMTLLKAQMKLRQMLDIDVEELEIDGDD